MTNNQPDLIWMLIARKLANEATEEDLHMLQQLLVEHPVENYSMELMQDLWNSQRRQDNQYAENQYKALVLRIQQSGNVEDQFSTDDIAISANIYAEKRNNNWVYWSISIFILGLISVFYFNRPVNPKELTTLSLPKSKNEIITSYGSRTSLVLPDGSKVWLNSGSKLTYDKQYGKIVREVKLEGEAYFDVQKNKDKPFIIYTSSIKIKVLGTAFNVRCYPDENRTETSLVRGSLEVTTNDGQGKIILKPNEKLVTNNMMIKSLTSKDGNDVKEKEPINNLMELSHLTVLPADSTVIETSWVYNKLIFRSETFEEVAHKMERWFAVSIRINDESLKGKKLTGIFEKETIKEALDAIRLTTRFSYKINEGKIIISN